MKSNEPIESADELVDMIDRLMQQGGGRVIVRTDDSAQGIKVNTFVSTDCADGAKGACCQPNEKDEGFDASQNGKG
ncbi:MAG: hypothetical protein ILA17_04750 [Ruminococcus sp.]|nr:hypothetical protein [Ruminococcus sp.]